jgi:hypothetical protein
VADNEKLTRDEIKELVFDVFVEIIEATGGSPALPPEEIAGLANEKPGRVKGCMREMIEEGVLDSFKEDGVEYFHLTEDVLGDLIAEMEADGWEPPDPLTE